MTEKIAEILLNTLQSTLIHLTISITNGICQIEQLQSMLNNCSETHCELCCTDEQTADTNEIQLFGGKYNYSGNIIFITNKNLVSYCAYL